MSEHAQPATDSAIGATQEKPRTHKPASVWIGLLALLLVPLLAAAYWVAIARAPGAGLFHDDGIYLVTAKALATGKGYQIISLPSPVPQTKYPYPVLFPFLLSLVWRVFPDFPDNVTALKLVPLAFGVLWLWFSCLLYRVEKVPREAGLLLIVLAASAGWTVLLSATLLAETLYAFLATAALLLLLGRDGRPRPSLTLYLAAVCAGAAALTRTVGIAVILAGIASLLLERRFRELCKFALVCSAVWLPWMAWSLNQAARMDALSFYYGVQSYQGWNILLNFGWGEKVTVAGINLLFWVFSPLALLDFKAPLILALVPFGIVVFGFITHARRRITVLHCYTVFYVAIVTCWAWPPTRFAAVLLPLVLFFGWQGCREVMARARWARFPITALGVILLLHSGWGVYARMLKTIREGSVPMGNQTVQHWYAIEPLLNWARLNTPRNAIILANLDPVVYLYTGRSAARPFHIDPIALHYAGGAPRPLGGASELRSIILQYGASYLFCTADQGFSERRHLQRVIRELAAACPGALKVVKEGRTEEYRVYQIAAGAVNGCPAAGKGAE